MADRVEKGIVAAMEELTRQHAEAKGIPGPYLFGYDDKDPPRELTSVGVDGYVDVVALVSAILKAADDGWVRIDTPEATETVEIHPRRPA